MKDLIGFDYMGIRILNPYISECGRFDVSPSYYGFSVDWTGGSCRAWARPTEDRGWIVITGSDGLTAPDVFEEGSIIGLYDGTGDEEMWGLEMDVHYLPSAQDILDLNLETIARLRSGFWTS